MTFVDIVDLLFVSCVLFFLPVNSVTNCTTGWFGLNCKYKCRCTDDHCDNDGLCINPSKCQKGWFGLACQYANVAYLARSIAVLTDGDDATCLTHSTGGAVTISLNSSYYVTWLRLHFKRSGMQTKIDVAYTHNSVRTECAERVVSLVHDQTIDIHCKIADLVSGLILTGEGVDQLCSVYVSGGRNMALKENVEQSDSYQEQSSNTNNKQVVFTADRAVDGDTNQRMYVRNGCARTTGKQALSDDWTIVFSQPRCISRFLIYDSLVVFGSRIRSFHLTMFDDKGKPSYCHIDQTHQHNEVYTVERPPATVSKLIISGSPLQKTLSLCEVEIYGDSLCVVGKYGRDCELSCFCAGNVSCFVNTGRCPSGCAAGYFGDTCTRSCDPSTFGPGCTQKCSEFCAKSTATRAICARTNGNCLHGCREGYTTRMCTTKCVAGKFGKDCRFPCSKNCASATSGIFSTCSNVNGTCLWGCGADLSGPYCDVSTFNYTMLEVILGISLVLIVTLMIIYCLRRGKQTQTDDSAITTHSEEEQQ